MNRLDELLLLWQDQSLGETELAELKRLLATPEGRAQVAEHLFLTGVVLETLQTQKAADEPFPRSEEGSAPEGQPALPGHRVSRRAVIALAATLLVALGAVLWFRNNSPPSPAPVPSAVFAQFEQVQGEAFVVSNEQRHAAQAGQVLVAGEAIGNPAIPIVREKSWPRSAVDSFLLAALEKRGLTPARDAEPPVLLRRLHYVLTGLPPTPEAGAPRFSSRSQSGLKEESGMRGQSGSARTPDGNCYLGVGYAG
jgi:hypothetical protein